MATQPSSLQSDAKGHELESEQTEDHIRVVARFRPINAKEKHEEKQQGLQSIPITLSADNKNCVNVPRGNKPALQFTLDDIIWTDSTQQETFDVLAKPLVDQVIKGYNCTIFAFGQTGSGKTYTMFGPDSYSRVENLGIIPRSVDYLFSSLAEAKDVVNYQVTLSVLEIYKEMIRDLLNFNNAKQQPRLEVFVSGKDVIIKNLMEQSCKDVDELLSFVVKAQASRKTRTTDFIGHQSSRSHCVVMISVTQKMLDDTVKTSKLNFGDLAGSEEASRTGATGETLQEAGKIHLGLLALQSVINALVEGKKHIPYKDSNLTRILKDSLGGNAKTTLLVACSPHIWNRSETVTTLRFAQRAKKIKNKARINKRRTRDQLEARIRSLEEMNLALRKKLKTKHQTESSSTTITITQANANVNADGSSSSTPMDDSRVKELETENERVQKQLCEKQEILEQVEQDMKAKAEMIDELNTKYTRKQKKFQQELSERTGVVEQLQTQLTSKDREIQRLTEMMSHNENLRETMAQHKQQLSTMVNESIHGQATSTVGVLHDLKQQFAFMQSHIEKIYNKQHEHDCKLQEIYDKEPKVVVTSATGAASRPTSSRHANAHPRKTLPQIVNAMRMRSDDTDTATGLGENQNENLDENDGFGDDTQTYMLALREETSVVYHDDEEEDEDELPKRQDTEQAFDDMIRSMKNYLVNTRTGRKMQGAMGDAHENSNDEDEATVKASTPLSLQLRASESVDTRTTQCDIDDMPEMKDDDESSMMMTQQQADDYTIGKKLDVLDASYHWYSAKIVEIDAFQKKAFHIKYDGFDDRWNEWILFKQQYKTAPHSTKSMGYGKKEGGLHCLLATKFGESGRGKMLRDAFDVNCDEVLLTEVAVLMEGYLFKLGKWKKQWKKRWFVLRNDGRIYYYENDRMERHKYRGVIPLDNVQSIVTVRKRATYTSYSFDLPTASRRYCLSALDEEDMADWLAVLECLMNNSLDSIAPKQIMQREHQFEPSISMSMDPEHSYDAAAAAAAAATPRARTQTQTLRPKSKHVPSKSGGHFHPRLTVTTASTADLWNDQNLAQSHGRGGSMIDRIFKKRSSWQTNEDSTHNDNLNSNTSQ